MGLILSLFHVFEGKYENKRRLEKVKENLDRLNREQIINAQEKQKNLNMSCRDGT